MNVEDNQTIFENNKRGRKPSGDIQKLQRSRRDYQLKKERKMAEMTKSEMLTRVRESGYNYVQRQMENKHEVIIVGWNSIIYTSVITNSIYL